MKKKNQQGKTNCKNYTKFTIEVKINHTIKFVKLKKHLNIKNK